jgi:WD40 repeat protein
MVLGNREHYRLQLWDTTTGEEIRFLQSKHSGRSMSFSPDGKLVALANPFQVWDVRTGEQPWQVPELGEYNLFDVGFSPDGRTLAAGLVFKVNMWDTASGRERCPIAEHRDRVSFVALAADGRTVVTAKEAKGAEQDAIGTVPDGAELRYWDVASGNRLLSPRAREKHFPPFAALSGDQQTLATWGDKGTLHVRDVASGKQLAEVSWDDYPNVRVFSDDGKFLVLGSDEPGLRGKATHSRLVLWDARMGKRLGEFKGHRGHFGDVRFSPDGKVLASITHGEHWLDVWDVATQKELFHFKPKPRVCWYLAFSRDSRMLAVTGLDPEVVFLEVPSGKELPKMPTAELAKKQPGGNYALLFSPDSKQLITSDNFGKVYIWQRDTGQLLQEWQAHQFRVSVLALSANGKVLLTRGANTALIWDLDNLLQREGSR